MSYTSKLTVLRTPSTSSRPQDTSVILKSITIGHNDHENLFSYCINFCYLEVVMCFWLPPDSTRPIEKQQCVVPLTALGRMIGLSEDANWSTPAHLSTHPTVVEPVRRESLSEADNREPWDFSNLFLICISSYDFNLPSRSTPKHMLMANFSRHKSPKFSRSTRLCIVEKQNDSSPGDM